MKAITIPKSKVKQIQKEINTTQDLKYANRLHGLLLISSQNMTCPEAANHLGKARNTTLVWVNKFNKDGLKALIDKERSGRPPRLTEEEMEKLKVILKSSPEETGISRNIWDGKTLSEYISKEFNVQLGVRQCQKLFHKLGFRLRKPRPMIAHADETKRQEFKKNIRLVS